MGAGRRGCRHRGQESLRELRIAEVTELDVQLDNAAIRAYRAKLKLSFKYESAD